MGKVSKTKGVAKKAVSQIEWDTVRPLEDTQEKVQGLIVTGLNLDDPDTKLILENLQISGAQRFARESIEDKTKPSRRSYTRAEKENVVNLYDKFELKVAALELINSLQGYDKVGYKAVSDFRKCIAKPPEMARPVAAKSYILEEQPRETLKAALPTVDDSSDDEEEEESEKYAPMISQIS